MVVGGDGDGRGRAGGEVNEFACLMLGCLLCWEAGEVATCSAAIGVTSRLEPSGTQRVQRRAGRDLHADRHQQARLVAVGDDDILRLRLTLGNVDIGEIVVKGRSHWADALETESQAWLPVSFCHYSWIESLNVVDIGLGQRLVASLYVLHCQWREFGGIEW